MRRILRHNPSPAMVVAIIALVVAIGGSAYAATQINGALIKKNSEPGDRIKKNTYVADATFAKTARDANTVGSKRVKQFFFKGRASSGGGAALSIDGIVVKAGCDSSGNPTATVENDSGVGAEVRGLVNNSMAPPSFGAITASSLKSADNILSTFVNGSGHFTVARSDGVVVSVLYSFDNPDTFHGQHVCTVNGSAIAS
jgi:hypothetical protein